MFGKRIIVFAVLVGWVFNPVRAADKCVPLTRSYPITTCTATTNTVGTADWTAVCETTGTPLGTVSGIAISGVAGCSNQGTGPMVSDNITTSTDESENIYCWCKMTSPVVSRWVRAGVQGTDTFVVCMSDCARYCATRLEAFPAMQNYMFFDNTVTD